MKIAFASKDGIHINEHFGWCEKFYLYEIDGEKITFLQQIDSSLKYDEEIEKLTYKIESIQEAQIICVSQIGPKAANMVQKVGIYPMRASSENDTIEDTLISLQKMINENTPLWLQRILLK